MILGTAAYMSPEQAKGRPVDKRADICVRLRAYEMVTARRPFDGEDITDTIARPLPTRDPPRRSSVVGVLRRIHQLCSL